MKKSKPTGQVPATESKAEVFQELTIKEEKFVYQYVKLNNATRAAIAAGYSMTSARQIGSENLSKPYIRAAIELQKEEWRRRADIDVEELLLIKRGIAEARPEEFALVLKDPTNEESYRKLGHKAHAIASITKSPKNGNSITFHNKQKAVDDLLDRVGKSKDEGRDRGAHASRIGGLIRKLRG